MVEIIVILPDGTKGKGQVDPSATIDEIKADIVKAFGLGDPGDFEIGFSPTSKKQALQNYTVLSGDIIRIYKSSDLRGPAFKRTI